MSVKRYKRHDVRAELGGYPRALVGRNTTAGLSQLSADATEILEVLVQASPNNTNVVLLGNQTVRSIELDPGEMITIPIDLLGKLYVVIQQGDYVNWIAVTV